MQLAIKPRAILALLTITLALCAFAPANALSLCEKPDPQEILDDDPDAGAILDVPFIAQKSYACGPASIAMVLQHHGIPADADEITRRFHTDAIAGNFTIDLMVAANQAGVESHWLASDLGELRDEIDQNRPPIVFLNLVPNPAPARHFAVAVGYIEYKKRDYIVLHSGRDPFIMVSKRKFLRQWKRTGKMMMTVAPPAPEEDGKESDD